QIFEETFPIKVIPTPNAFSPNNDGLNDKFRLIAENLPEEQFQMKIYNRWGQMIFETNDIEEGWDGTYKSEICQEGVYVWIVVSSEKDNNVLNKGTVTLVR
ncbi:MAG: gliding motility-associated C-terminal domain-containing protein, partial [Bacteroidales bacterium]|nr:gliding motility-associated C-terminal domain-containing protein [Bacteroidales bacterium]